MNNSWKTTGLHVPGSVSAYCVGDLRQYSAQGLGTVGFWDFGGFRLFGFRSALARRFWGSDIPSGPNYDEEGAEVSCSSWDFVYGDLQTGILSSMAEASF